MQKYYENEPKFNSAYSRINLFKINDGAYIVNLDECELIGIYWIVLYVNDNSVTHLIGILELNIFQKKIKNS